MNVQEFLRDQDVAFDVIPHEGAFDASHLAQSLHVPGRRVAKTVLLRADHGYRYFVVVLNANQRIDMDRLSHCLCGCHLELASENEVAKHCPDCEVGVLPPFGSQYGLTTVIDEDLAADTDEEFVFDGNRHSEAIRMRVSDFRSIEQPLVCPLGEQGRR